MNTYSERTEIRAHREPWLRDSIAIRLAHITEQNGVTKVALAESMVLKTLSEEELCRELPPTMRISPEDAQQFMDELWRTGIRPTEGAGSVGQLCAIKAHLEDMRTLVFKKVDA